MNEPIGLTKDRWIKYIQYTISKLRSLGVNNLIVASGSKWAGAHSWFSGGDAQRFLNVKDPINRTIIELHQYTDSGTYYAGTTTECAAPEKLAKILANVTAWGKENNQRFMLGEFGVASTSDCLATLGAMLEEMDNTVWAGWTYWAAGAWWGSYPYSIHPTNGVEKPQVSVLKQHTY